MGVIGVCCACWCRGIGGILTDTANYNHSQTINDWYDREIDAINEPYRPIPSGRITEPQVIGQIWALLLGGLGLAGLLDLW